MWYDVLGVKPDATIEEVNEAYKRFQNITDEKTILEIAEAYVSACEELGEKPYKERKFRNRLNKIMYVIVASAVILVSGNLLYKSIKNTYDGVTMSDVQKCLGYTNVQTHKLDLDRIYNKLEENGYEIISYNVESVNKNISAQKTMNDRTVDFSYTGGESREFCTISISDKIPVVYRGVSTSIKRSVESSEDDKYTFNYSIFVFYNFDDEASPFLFSEEFSSEATKDNFVIKNKEKYKGEEFYDFISEEQALIDRDILISEVEKLTKGR